MSDYRVEDLLALDAPRISAIERLVEHVTLADGLAPLDEHVLLHVRHGGDTGARHLLVWGASITHENDDNSESTDLIGYAHLDATDAVEGAVAEIVVTPEHRRLGVGRFIVELLLQSCSQGRLRLWAHGEQAASARLAAAMGFTRTRVLWQMRRSLFAPLPRPHLPEGVRLRSFRPGLDDEAWLRVNARAFEHHPDQGRWTIDDLHLRMAEPWFDADGFLLAVTGDDADDTVVGFHWTKVHGHDADHDHGSLGEVYVVGVDPDWQRSGLGKALTIAGLSYLRSLGLGQAMLYVDAVNTNAIKVYESLGFARWDTDVMFIR